LLAAIPATSTSGLRDRALFAVLWRTGMRISEALSLHESDLHESTGYIRIRRGRKNGRGRDVFVFGSAETGTYGWDQLRPWLSRRAELGIARTAPVFCVHSAPTRGKRLGDSQVRESLQRYVLRAGLQGRFHLHGFRHTLAAELYRDGVKLARIKHQLGHASLAVTQTYLEQCRGSLRRWKSCRSRSRAGGPKPPCQPAPSASIWWSETLVSRRPWTSRALRARASWPPPLGSLPTLSPTIGQNRSPAAAKRLCERSRASATVALVSRQSNSARRLPGA
jgi:hypothetical protein